MTVESIPWPPLPLPLPLPPPPPRPPLIEPRVAATAGGADAAAAEGGTDDENEDEDASVKESLGPATVFVEESAFRAGLSSVTDTDPRWSVTAAPLT